MQIEKLIKFACLLAIIAVGLSGTIFLRGLYADGSHFLLEILARNDFWLFDKPRLHIQFLNQVFPVIAIKLGVIDLQALTFIYSAGLLLPTSAVWFVALYLQRNTPLFWWLILGYSSTFLLSGFFSIGEYNLTYAFVALYFSIAYPKIYHWGQLAFLALIALTLIRSYEAMLFLGPCLALATVCLSLQTKERAKKFFALFLLCVLGTSTLVATFSIIYPRDPNNLTGALNIIRAIQGKQAMFLVLATLLALVIRQAAKQYSSFSLTIFFVFSLIYFLSDSWWQNVSQQHSTRTLSGLMLASILSIKIGQIFFHRKKENHATLFIQKPFIVSSALVCLSLSITTIMNDREFGHLVKLFKAELASIEKNTPINKTNLYEQKPNLNRFIWAWTNPSMSLVLGGQRGRLITNNENYAGWQPFNPNELSAYDLPRYKSN